MSGSGGSQNATLVVPVLLVLGISSLKIPKFILIRSAAQRNVAYTFVLIFPRDLPFCCFDKQFVRSTDFGIGASTGCRPIVEQKSKSHLNETVLFVLTG